MFISSEDNWLLLSSRTENTKESEGLAYKLIDEENSFELDICICVYFNCIFLDAMSMCDSVCSICEEEKRYEEPWKCQTCVFECHKQCIKQWIKYSVHEGCYGKCPYCRSPIHPLQDFYTKEEIFALCYLLCFTPISPSADINSLD